MPVNGGAGTKTNSYSATDSTCFAGLLNKPVLMNTVLTTQQIHLRSVLLQETQIDLTCTLHTRPFSGLLKQKQNKTNKKGNYLMFFFL